MLAATRADVQSNRERPVDRHQYAQSFGLGEIRQFVRKRRDGRTHGKRTIPNGSSGEHSVSQSSHQFKINQVFYDGWKRTRDGCSVRNETKMEENLRAPGENEEREML